MLCRHPCATKQGSVGEGGGRGGSPGGTAARFLRKLFTLQRQRPLEGNCFIHKSASTPEDSKRRRSGRRPAFGKPQTSRTQRKKPSKEKGKCAPNSLDPAPELTRANAELRVQIPWGARGCVTAQLAYYYFIGRSFHSAN